MSFPRYPAYKNSGVNWLGAIPSHWAVTQSRRVFTQRKDRAAEGTRQLTASQKLGIVYQDDYMASEGQKVVQVIHGADILKQVEPNDFVISMRSFQGGIEWSELRGSISSAYVMLIPNEQVHPAFYRYLFKAQPYIQALQSTTNLVRDGQALRFDNFAQVDLPVVPSDEQVAIAKLLDRETAKIDALVAEQEQLITLLKEKRQAVISHAVTKGLDPSVPMKDSGVEWLGRVPAHWSAVRLKFLAYDIKAGPFGSALTKDMYASSGYRVYGQEQVIPGDFSIGDYYIDEATFAQLAQYATQEGDVLISCVGTFGKIAVVPENAEPGIINPRLIRLRLVDGVSPNYLAEVLRSTVTFEQFSVLSRGGTMDVINIGTLSDIWVAVPPYSEQQSILENLQRLMREFDALVDEAVLSIELLRERRSALISAAVTGQIDVRGLATAKEAA